MKTYLSLLIQGMEICVPVDFEYDYQPPEPPTSTYPGCGASIVVTEVKLHGQDIIDILTDAQAEEMVDACWEHLEREGERRQAMAEDAYDTMAELQREELSLRDRQSSPYRSLGRMP